MRWYVIDKKYVEYLNSFDKKVENVDYGESLKPYIGIILNINKFNYYVPVSSPKNKHLKMKNNIDIFKIVNKTQLLGVLNINNMIPVDNDNINCLEYKEIEEYRKFDSDNKKIMYIKLLSMELNIINRNLQEIKESAKKLYQIKLKYPNEKISLRCCDFELLEQKCIEYNRKK